MKTQFLSIVEKAELARKIEAGDTTAMEYMLNEMDRLESIIRDYEIVIGMVAAKLEPSVFKTPKPYETPNTKNSK